MPQARAGRFGVSVGERADQAAEEYTAASFLEVQKDLKGIASARKMVVGLRRGINVNDIRIRRESIAIADLSRHFQQRELVRANTRIAYSTRKAYEGYLKRWIEPRSRWGYYRLIDIRAVKSNRG